MSTPRYMQIAQAMLAQRAKLTRPMRIADELTLAAKHDVARDTIRRALQYLAVEHNAVVRRPSVGTYLQPVQTAQTRMRGKAIGFIPPWWADSSADHHTSAVFSGLSQWADEHDCCLSVLHAGAYPRSDDDWLACIHDRKLCGVIWLHPQSNQMKLAHQIAKAVPLVVVGRDVPGSSLHVVMPDYDQAATLIDARLRQAGHDDYAIVGTDILGGYSQSWIRALAACHQQVGRDFDPSVQFVDVRAFDRQRLWPLLAEHYRPHGQAATAFVLTHSSFLSALVADEAFTQAAGRDVSVVAVDYGVYPMASYWPARQVDHIDCDWPGVGRQVMGVFSQLIHGHVIPRVRTLPVRLVAGRTVMTPGPADEV